MFPSHDQYGKEATVPEKEKNVEKMAAEIEQLKSRANLNDHEARRINYQIPKIIEETVLAKQNGRLAVANRNLSELRSTLTHLSAQEKAIIVKMAEMDLAILEQPSGEKYRKLRLLKGVTISSAAALTADESYQGYKNILQHIINIDGAYQKHIGQPFEKKFNQLRGK